MPSSEYITELVALALKEDVGTGDITAGLISPDCEKRARVITREAGILCGTQFVDGVFRALDPQLEITWHRRTAIHWPPMICCSQSRAMPAPS